MAIRLRQVNSIWIALCAARSVPKEGDVYLDDAQHHALGCKFSSDYNAMYNFDLPCASENADLIECEESNNVNREWWDKTYGE